MSEWAETLIMEKQSHTGPKAQLVLVDGRKNQVLPAATIGLGY
jgi:hypothetical protein